MIDRFKSMLSLALDPAAAEGETLNAIRFIRKGIQNGKVKKDDLIGKGSSNSGGSFSDRERKALQDRIAYLEAITETRTSQMNILQKKYYNLKNDYEDIVYVREILEKKVNSLESDLTDALSKQETDKVTMEKIRTLVFLLGVTLGITIPFLYISR